MVMLGMALAGFLITSCAQDPTTTQRELDQDRVMVKGMAGAEAALGGLMAATMVIPGIGRASNARAKELAQILAAAEAQAQAQAAPARRYKGRFRPV